MRLFKSGTTGALLFIYSALAAHAQIAPFTPSGYSVPALSSTTASAATTMPAGTQSVLVQNVGADAVFCQPGATATASALYIPSGSGFIFPMGSVNKIACIDQSTTSTVNFIPGSGFSVLSSGGGTGSGSGAASAVYPSGGAAGTSNGLGNTDANAFDFTLSGPAISGYADPSNCTRPSNPGSQFYVQCIVNVLNSPVLFPVNITPHDCSVALTLGGTAQNIITGAATIHGFTVANIDASAGSGEPVWFSMTTTAAASTIASYPLPPPQATTFAGYGTFTAPAGYGINHNVSAVAATTGHKISCTYW